MEHELRAQLECAKDEARELRQQLAAAEARSEKVEAEFLQQKAATGLMLLERNKLAELLWKLQPAVDLDHLESEDPEAACDYDYFIQDRAALTQENPNDINDKQKQAMAHLLLKPAKHEIEDLTAPHIKEG